MVATVHCTAQQDARLCFSNATRQTKCFQENNNCEAIRKPQTFIAHFSQVIKKSENNLPVAKDGL